MKKNLETIIEGYHLFRKKYAHDSNIMEHLSRHGQSPQIMVISCCDSRVDPALILQCDPGDLFVVRNVANIVPPYEVDDAHHGTSAALEFAITFLKVKHLIILGHSQCGGIQALLNNENSFQNDFITNWVSLIKPQGCEFNDHDADSYAKEALHLSHQNCLTFPWVKEKVDKEDLSIHLWFFDIKKGQILAFSEEMKSYIPLDE